MLKPIFIKVYLFFTALFVIIIILFNGCKRQDVKPNVVYICIEDMGVDLGCYGDTIVHSPNIDHFAKEALLFEDVHCQVALCTPSRNSILTGVRPSTSGMVKIDDNWQEMLPHAVSLPRHFRNNGYYTIQAGKIHDYRCGGMDSAYNKVLDIHGLHDNVIPLQAIEIARAKEKPVFIAIGYGKVHDIWDPSEGAKNFYSLETFSPAGRSNSFKGKEISDDQIIKYQRDYYADITDVDSLIGNVLDTLKKVGLYDKSIIMAGVFDHGYTLGRHDKWGKGGNTDMETHVPMIIRVPDSPNNGQRVKGMVELVDIYPALIDLCQLPLPPQKLEGLSFRPLLNNPDMKWKKAVFTHRAYHISDRGLKTKEYTLITRKNEKAQLFDRINDPENLNNIAVKYPEKVRELTKLLERGWEGALPDQIPREK